MKQGWQIKKQKILSQGKWNNRYTHRAGWKQGWRKLSLLVLVGQKEHLHGNNCIIDTDSSLNKGTEVKYHEVSFELPANSHNKYKGQD